MGHYCSVSI